MSRFVWSFKSLGDTRGLFDFELTRDNGIFGKLLVSLWPIADCISPSRTTDYVGNTGIIVPRSQSLPGVVFLSTALGVVPSDRDVTHRASIFF